VIMILLYGFPTMVWFWLRTLPLFLFLAC